MGRYRDSEVVALEQFLDEEELSKEIRFTPINYTRHVPSTIHKLHANVPNTLVQIIPLELLMHRIKITMLSGWLIQDSLESRELSERMIADVQLALEVVTFHEYYVWEIRKRMDQTKWWINHPDIMNDNRLTPLIVELRNRDIRNDLEESFFETLKRELVKPLLVFGQGHGATIFHLRLEISVLDSFHERPVRRMMRGDVLHDVPSGIYVTRDDSGVSQLDDRNPYFWEWIAEPRYSCRQGMSSQTRNAFSDNNLTSRLSLIFNLIQSIIEEKLKAEWVRRIRIVDSVVDSFSN